MNSMFVYDVRDVLAMALLVLFAVLLVGAWLVSWASLAWCKVRGHRFRAENPEPFAPCLRCGRRVG